MSGNNAHNLSSELFVAIFSLFSFLDIVTCRKVCKRFRDIIDSSLYLQYLIEAGVCGYAPLPETWPLTVPERLRHLKNFHDRWKSPNPTPTRTVTLDYSSLHKPHEKCRYKIHDNVIAVCANSRVNDTFDRRQLDWIRVFNLGATDQEKGHHTHILDETYDFFEFDPLEDTLIVGRAIWDDILFSHDKGKTLLKPLSLRTEGTHPMALKENIHIPVLCFGSIPARICGSFMALSNSVCRSETSVTLVNWRSGSSRIINHPMTGSVNDLVFLSESCLAILYSGDAFVLSSAHGSDWSRDLTHVKFHLPRTSASPKLMETRDIRLQSSLDRSVRGPCKTVPPEVLEHHPSATSAEILTLYRSSLIRNNENDADDDWDLEEISHLAVISVRKILRLMKSCENGDLESLPEVPWESWGPSCSRWFINLPQPDAVRNVPLFGYHIICNRGVLDFNSAEKNREYYRGQGAAQHHPTGIPRAEWIDEAHTISGGEIFAHDITSWLPYCGYRFQADLDIPWPDQCSPNSSLFAMKLANLYYPEQVTYLSM